MAEPKKKRSKSRQGNSRSHKNIVAAASLSICSICKQKKLPHTVCQNCGNYNNQKVLNVK